MSCVHQCVDAPPRQVATYMEAMLMLGLGINARLSHASDWSWPQWLCTSCAECGPGHVELRRQMVLQTLAEISS